MAFLRPVTSCRPGLEKEFAVRVQRPLIAVLLAVAVVPGAPARSPTLSAHVIQAVVTDPSRPAADVMLDGARKPAEMLALAGVRRGMTVVDLFPGGGYFTRLFSIATGPSGRVIAQVPEEQASRMPRALTRIGEVAAESGRGNVTVTHDPLLKPFPPGSVDVVWTSQNYHDIAGMGVDIAAFNKVVFDALKPGGVFMVIDHRAAPGSGRRDTTTLHRIDAGVVRSEVEAAGFVLDGESTALVNPVDDHTLRVFDPTIRGQTDQFAYCFRKPAPRDRRQRN